MGTVSSSRLGMTRKTSCDEEEPQKTIIFVVSEDWYFLSHRLPMARAARDAGFRVVVATRVWSGAQRIRDEGFEVVPVEMDRGSTSVLRELRAVASLCRLFSRTRPDIVHNISVKPIVLGGLAALIVPSARVINSYTGLGSVLSDYSRDGLVKRAINRILRGLRRRKAVHAIVQNDDDYRLLIERRLADPGRIMLVPGSGVDTEGFRPTPEPQVPVVATMVSRLLRDKGLCELMEAARLLKAREVPIRIRIVGDIDPDNPTSVGQEELADWVRQDLADFVGRKTDIAREWRTAHIAVLPSYREGMPKALLEAAASGRPLVTTDVPGCRDLVPNGETGLLVPARDAEALADALEHLAVNADERRTKGAAARRLVEDKFSERAIMERMSEVYRQLS